jgi:DNA-binding transcriptional LysR family regulator
MTPLSELHLEAFYSVATEGSFTRASEMLHISQPALSRRLQGLEETLGLTLFERTPTGVELTEAAQKLLLYVKNKQALEKDALDDILGNSHTLHGLIRIAAHSSILEPVVMPALAPFLLKYPEVQVEFAVKSNAELDEMLNYSKTDIILSNHMMARRDIIEEHLGNEEFICIESKTPTTRSHVYLDVAPEDRITESFFNIQENPPKKYSRSFMHDENGILRGVQLGLGRAIKPRHTVKTFDDLKIVRGFVPMIKPVYLRFSKKQYYTALEKAVLDVLKKEVPKVLK